MYLLTNFAENLPTRWHLGGGTSPFAPLITTSEDRNMDYEFFGGLDISQKAGAGWLTFPARAQCEPMDFRKRKSVGRDIEKDCKLIHSSYVSSFIYTLQSSPYSESNVFSTSYRRSFGYLPE